MTNEVDGPSDSNKLAAKLRDIRKAAGITQAQVAHRCGLSDSFVTLVEGGKRKPPAELMAVYLALASPEDRGRLTRLWESVREQRSPGRPSSKGAIHSIVVAPEELATLAQVLEIEASETSNRLSHLRAQVGGLPWRGQAAVAFDAYLAKWSAAQNQLNEALQGMAGLLGLASNLYAEAEAQIVKTIERPN